MCEAVEIEEHQVGCYVVIHCAAVDELHLLPMVCVPITSIL